MRIGFILPAAMLALSGCTNLAAVESASGELVEAARSWDGPAREIAALCERYDQISANVQDCTTSVLAADGLIGANTVLIAYFEALRDSAAAGNFTVREPLEAAVGAASRIPGAPAAQVEAVGGLARILADLATRAARERTIKRLIDDGAPPARNVIALLDRLVAARLPAGLDRERELLILRFEDLIGPRAQALMGAGEPCATPPRLRDAGPDGGQALLLAADLCTRYDRLKERVVAAAQYRQSLQAADKTLAALQAGEMRLSAKDTAVALIALAGELDAGADSIRSAFGRGEP